MAKVHPPIHEQILTARTELGLSQTEAAKRIGITQSTYSRLETGEHEPRLSKLQRVADALQVTLTIIIRPS